MLRLVRHRVGALFVRRVEPGSFVRLFEPGSFSRHRVEAGSFVRRRQRECVESWRSWFVVVSEPGSFVVVVWKLVRRRLC